MTSKHWTSNQYSKYKRSCPRACRNSENRKIYSISTSKACARPWKISSVVTRTAISPRLTTEAVAVVATKRPSLCCHKRPLASRICSYTLSALASLSCNLPAQKTCQKRISIKHFCRQVKDIISLKTSLLQRITMVLNRVNQPLLALAVWAPQRFFSCTARPRTRVIYKTMKREAIDGLLVATAP